VNICYCGTQAGYPHRDECPRPLFRATPAEEERWELERQERANLKTLRRVCPYQLGKGDTMTYTNLSATIRTTSQRLERLRRQKGA